MAADQQHMETHEQSLRLAKEEAKKTYIRKGRSRSRNNMETSTRIVTKKQNLQLNADVANTKRIYQKCMRELLSVVEQEDVHTPNVEQKGQKGPPVKGLIDPPVSAELSWSSARSNSPTSFGPRSPEPKKTTFTLPLHLVSKEERGSGGHPGASKHESRKPPPHRTGPHQARSWWPRYAQSPSAVPVQTFLSAFVRDLVQILLDTLSQIWNGIKQWLPTLISLSLLLDLAMYNFCILPFATSILSGYCPPSNPISLQLICRIPYVQPVAFCQPRNEPLFAPNGSTIASETTTRMRKAFEENEEPITAMLNAASYMKSLSGETQDFRWAIGELINVVIRSPKDDSEEAMENLLSLRRDNEEIHELLLDFAYGVEIAVWYQRFKTRSTAERLKSVVQPPCPRLTKIGRWLPLTESQLFEIQDYFCPNSFYRIPEIVESHVNFTQPSLDTLLARASRVLEVLKRARITIDVIKGYASGYRDTLESERAGIVARRSSLSEILIHFKWASDDTQYVHYKIAALDRMENGYYEAIKPLEFTEKHVRAMKSHTGQLIDEGAKMVGLVNKYAVKDRAEGSHRFDSRKEIAIQFSKDLIDVSEAMMISVDRLKTLEDQLKRGGDPKPESIGDDNKVWSL